MTITVAVLSDLHFFVRHREVSVDPSLLALRSGTNPLQFADQYNPWTELESLLQKEGLTADLLLCPGDITTWADTDALRVAWGELIKVGVRLNADVVAAATGNHDVVSRAQKEEKPSLRELNEPIDLFEPLKQLDPPYPLHFLQNFDEEVAHRHRVQYFGADFVLYDSDPRYRLIIFNSCGRHTTVDSTYERGRAAESSLAWLERQLGKLNAAEQKINLLICHHHPVQHEELRLGSYDFMQNGSVLLDRLTKHGDWIVFHGHKHHPRMLYSQGQADSALVFSAGSLSAIQQSVLQDIPNQFYVLEISNNDLGSPRGTVKAWNWHVRDGWCRAVSSQNGIFYGCGFGARQHPAAMAKAISAIASPPMSWEKVLEEVPELRYATPVELQNANRILEANYGLKIQLGPNGAYNEVARIA